MKIWIFLLLVCLLVIRHPLLPLSNHHFVSYFQIDRLQKEIWTGSWFKDHFVPDKCVPLHYHRQDVLQCTSHLTIKGDSTARALYYSLKRRLFHNTTTDTTKHSDLSSIDSEMTLLFQWDPFLNQTLPAQDNQTVISAGLWFIKHHLPVSLFLDRLLEQPTSHVTLIPPIHEPFLSPDKKVLTLAKIAHLNQKLKNEPLRLLPSLEKVYATAPSLPKDGIHYDDQTMDQILDLTLHSICPPSNVKRSTCFTSYPGVNMSQGWVFGFLFLLMLLSGIEPFMKKWFSTKLSALIPNRKHALDLMILCGVLLLNHVSDRTMITDKALRTFDLFRFGIPLVLVFLASLKTLKKTDTPYFLHREQTEEWKGWMQLIILMYHYTGASSIAPIYNLVRWLVGCYLFLTGYGHFSYFYLKSEFGFRRVMEILIRLNMLSILLSYVMDTNLLFYYFGPLVSFWFLVIYATMYIQSSWNSTPRLLFFKVAFSALFVNLVISKDVLLPWLFHGLNSHLKTRWDWQEAKFRIQLDGLIVYVGMLMSFANIKTEGFKNYREKKWCRCLAIMTLIGYICIITHIPNKRDYTKIHWWGSIPPTIAYALLRNMFGGIKKIHVGLFSWIGRISLETYIMQFHLWLAMDTRARLVLIPGHYWFNLWVVSIFFISLSDLVAMSTQTLTKALAHEPLRWILILLVLILNNYI